MVFSGNLQIFREKMFRFAHLFVTLQIESKWITVSSQLATFN